MISWKLITNFSKFTTLLQLGTNMNSVDFEVKRWRSQWDHTWSNKHFGRHFVTCLQNAWTYFDETYHHYSLHWWYFQGSKVKVTDNIFWKCIFFLAEAATWLTVHHGRLSSLFVWFQNTCKQWKLTNHLYLNWKSSLVSAVFQMFDPCSVGCQKL